ncbi:MAG: type II secretion system protein [Phycisphaerae bacterium]
MLRPHPTSWARRTAYQGGGFSLVELLTVVFIISLLISILIPSLTSARNAAKKARTNADIRALGTALQLFKNDNERDFPQTNGFPPSFSHPPIRESSGGDSVFDPVIGEFPFVKNTSVTPIAYGAHWLPAMLMGVDQLGYVPRKNVPPEFRSQPDQWYVPNPGGGSDEPFPRMPFYIEPGGVKTVRTEDLRGRPPSNMARLFPTWEETRHLPVFVDSFDQPILYYVANRHGRKTNMVDIQHNASNRYDGGPPYYFHVDNWGFTGKSLQNEDGWGWDFGGGGDHPIAEPGDELTADLLMQEEHRKTFARFVLDRTIASKFEEALNEGETIDANAPLLPANPDSFLLISAGVDGQYGTSDDITNYPLSVE